MVVNSMLTGTTSAYWKKGLSAYQEAVLEGFQGSRSEWLESLKANNIVLRLNDDTIQWKYSTDTEWKNLIKIEKDYEELYNRPLINGQILEGEIDGMLDGVIKSQFDEITSTENFRDEFSLSNIEIESLLNH